MNSVEIITKNSPEHYKYLCSQVEIIETLQYFENIKKYPTGSFLLGVYNIVSIIKEHNLHIAITTTKVGSESNVKVLAKILYENTCVENESVSEQFEKFLIQFRDKNYPDAYYKKYSAVLPIDKLSNDLCQIILDKNWVQVVASLATFELVLSKISAKFNSYAQTDFTLLNTERGEKNCVALLEILEGQEKYDVRNGAIDTMNVFASFFNEIDSQFYCD